SNNFKKVLAHEGISPANWTFNGFSVNHEANVAVKDKKTVSVLENTFEHDWNNMTQEELPDIPAEGANDQAG
ncbi:MAG: phospholipase D family protein, partial [Candidatus Pacearchaeota archaeon]|nr:phospholipase D family protein [Candidatus Pacearchaeota archaeon]